MEPSEAKLLIRKVYSSDVASVLPVLSYSRTKSINARCGGGRSPPGWLPGWPTNVFKSYFSHRKQSLLHTPTILTFATIATIALLYPISVIDSRLHIPRAQPLTMISRNCNDQSVRLSHLSPFLCGYIHVLVLAVLYLRISLRLSTWFPEKSCGHAKTLFLRYSISSLK